MTTHVHARCSELLPEGAWRHWGDLSLRLGERVVPFAEKLSQDLEQLEKKFSEWETPLSRANALLRERRTTPK
jgi:hypothetical protein